MNTVQPTSLLWKLFWRKHSNRLLPDLFQDFLGSITLEGNEGKPLTPVYSHAVKKKVIPAGGMRFVATDVCCKTVDTWAVTKFFSSRPSREWIIPNYVVMAGRKALYIPVVNLSNRSLQWNKGSALAAVELLQEPVVRLVPKAKLFPHVCSLSNSSVPVPMTDVIRKNLIIGKDLTSAQRERLLNLFDFASIIGL